ncbi:ISAs1 family transposase [Fimbriiglobus ruber]|uniref:Mobile element protein n=1 Tax=Fimbriiglobus ruber TaxID=1908690 RepID=A0A225E1A6_9BACT|nr:ISAs1 family transposase [Fimbriiglobus ruber]OWK43269.1 Mobile element protein [Fimbriiglobus ruber]
MDTTPTAPFVEAFRTLEDPRRPGRTLAHNLHEILTIALCAAIGGANDWVAVETFGRAKIGWFRRFLPLAHGIPSHDTFGRVFAHLTPAAFRACFGQWIADVCGKLGLAHIAIDGKRLAGSEDAGAGIQALHLVSAWATDARLSLGQVAVDDKSNEITAIPQLLERIEISGALVSIDAMGCQKEIAATIRANRGDDLLAVKDNQPHLKEDIESLSDRALETEFATGTWDWYAKEETNRGRAEMRQCWVLTGLEELAEIRDRALWTDLKSVIVVVSERGVGGRVRPRPGSTSVVGWPRPDSSPGGRGLIGALRTPSQTTGEATTCARSGDRLRSHSRPFWRWPRGATSAPATEAPHVRQRPRPRSPRR